MSKDYISAINFGITMCGGLAFRDIVSKSMKGLPHSNSLVMMIGRSAIRAGAFVVGADISAKGVKFATEVVDAYRKKTENASDSVEVVEEDQEEDGRAE